MDGPGSNGGGGRDFPQPSRPALGPKMRTESFPGVNSGRGVTLTPHLLLVPWSRKSRAIHVPLLPLWIVRPVESLSACTTVHFTFTYTSTPPMGRTACTEPQCLYNGALYLYLYLYSPYRPYGLYRASVPVQRCTLPLLVFLFNFVDWTVFWFYTLKFLINFVSRLGARIFSSQCLSPIRKYRWT